jgi:hypothetical protein
MFDANRGTWFCTNTTGSGISDLAFGGVAPEQFSALTDAPVPLFAVVLDRPKQRGVTMSLHLPEALAKRLESPEGQALMHSR